MVPQLCDFEDTSVIAGHILSATTAKLSNLYQTWSNSKPDMISPGTSIGCWFDIYFGPILLTGGPPRVCSGLVLLHTSAERETGFMSL